MITGAAAIMVTVFAAFALADAITIKSIGVGMAIAVLVDATIVRILLVPATMRLLGKWNWWAPGPLARFADRLGFSHVEDEATVPTGDETAGAGGRPASVPPDRPDPRAADGVPEAPGASAVPDLLAPGLRLVFVGINPGRASAAAAAHFANPRNDFWRLLEASGLTPELLGPKRQREVLRFGIGITNAALRTTPGSGDLRAADFADSAARLGRVASELAPAVMAFVGKEAYRGAFRERPDLGVQERTLGTTRLFVLPSTSPANAAVPWADRLRWFRELAATVDRLAPSPGAGDRATLPGRGTEVP